MDIPEKRLMHVRPEREELICSTCEALGYRLQEAKRADHMDTELLFQLEDPEAVSNSCRAKAESLLARLMQLDAQVTRTIGLIPSAYMVSSMLGDALDDVERVSGKRCDGFSSSVFNCIITISGGIALCAFNFGISHLGYLAPTADMIPVQPPAIQSFLIFCVIGIQLIAYPLIGVLSRFFPKDKPQKAAK